MTDNKATLDQSQVLWDEFLLRFPREKLSELTLHEYIKADDQTTFTYWVGRKLQPLGNLPAKAEKFGIYPTSNTSDSTNDGIGYKNGYAWKKKRYGKTLEEAFELVKTALARVAQAAYEGDVQTIDAEKHLWPIFKWKIAFLYQNREKPIFPAIYSDRLLQAASGTLAGTSHVEAMQALMADYDGIEDIQSFSKRKLKSAEENAGKWYYSEYKYPISKATWLELWDDTSIFKPETRTLVACLKAIGGSATCAKLAHVYGRASNYYNKAGSALGKRILDRLNLPPYAIDDDGSIPYWPFAFEGRYVDKRLDDDTPGVFLWKLRDELSEALEEIDWSAYAKPEKANLNECIEDAAEDSTNNVCDDKDPPAYTEEMFLNEVWMSSEDFHRLKGLLARKKNIILQGPPGVGKTFAARRLAWAIMGHNDERRIRMVQFHQNYAYEDFVIGYKPSVNGFELRKGIFYEFCQKARANPEHRYFFIIDEINRGNLSKILGELMMLIEADHRGERVTLPGLEEPFYVPENVFIIGMMNTADRSLAMIDYALRRRFSFFTMTPCFKENEEDDIDGFKTYATSVRNALGVATGQKSRFDELVDVMRALNTAIADDPSLGKGFLIGHSYLGGIRQPKQEDSSEASLSQFNEWLYGVVNYDLLPLLEEYWYDDEETLKDWSNRLQSLTLDH